MKKIIAAVCGIMLMVQGAAYAEVQRSQVANVVSIRSSFDYRDPVLMQEYLQKKAQQEAQKNQKQQGEKDEKEQEKLIEPPAMFHIYMNNDRFYDRDKDDAGKYTSRVDIAFSSHDRDRNYIFDKDCAPYLLVRTGSDETVLKFKKFKFDNPYWISFALTKEEIDVLKNADSVTAVLPEATADMYSYNNKKERIEKDDYKKSMEIREMKYDLPDYALQEWKEVLADL